MCPQREYVDQIFDHVLQTIQIRSAENIVLNDVCWLRLSLMVGRGYYPFNTLLRTSPWQLQNALTPKRLGIFGFFLDRMSK